MPLATGTRIGVYEIVCLIGSGGMGDVYRARDSKLNRDVAIKMVRDDLAGPDRLSRFHREAQVLAGLNHSNIGAIYGMEDVPPTADQPARHALVLEFVEGPTLADRIALGAIPLDETVAIARQIADAVAAAHDRGIIHRDLKPANIKLRPDGTVKILDFGLAKVFADDGGSSDALNSPTLSLAATRAGVILGTAAYMSPEQARGKAVDKRTDVWAFGCILYEMLTGRRAFASDEVSDTLAFVITKDIDWSALPPSTPAAMRRLLTRCLEKDRNLRLRDIGDASLDLRDAAASPHDIVIGPPSRPTPRWRVALGALAAAAVGGAIAAAAIWAVRPAPHAPQVRTFMVPLPPGTAIPAAGVSRSTAISPDGLRVAFVATDGRLLMRRFDSLDLTPMVAAGLAGGGITSSPFFSPDGQSIGYFLAGTSDMKRVAVTGGPSTPITRAIGVARGATWTRDGTIIFATTDSTSGLLSVPAAGGEAKVLTKVDTTQGEVDHIWPEGLPDGRSVLFTIVKAGGLQNAEIAVLDRDTGTKKVLVRGGSHAQYIPSGHLIYAAVGMMRAVAFDAPRLEVRGDPVPLPIRVMTGNTGGVNAAVSTDGTLVYAPGGAGSAAERRLVWVDRDGREDPIPADQQPYGVPRVSPDGTRIAVHLETDTPDVAVYDIVRQTAVRLTFGNASSIRPGWSIDGRWVFFRSDANGPAIYRKAADGSGDIQRITPVTGDGSLHSFSPDGRFLVYAQIDPVTARDLWMVDVEGKDKPQPLVVEPGDQANAVISPDGRWIAYHSSVLGEIYVRPFPKVAGGRWQVVPSGAKWPLWSRDGRELFFVTARGIASVGVDADQTFRWSSPQPIVEGSYVGFAGFAGPRNYDLSKDGRRFLVIKEGGRAEQTTELIVVENWTEELKRLVPAR